MNESMRTDYWCFCCCGQVTHLSSSSPLLLHMMAKRFLSGTVTVMFLDPVLLHAPPIL